MTCSPSWVSRLMKSTNSAGAASSESGLDMDTDKLLVDVDDGIARITFNNPARHNALSVEMIAALPGGWSRFNATRRCG